MRYWILCVFASFGALFASSCGGKSSERPGAPTWGAACGGATTCTMSDCVDDPSFPGGYCTRICDDMMCGDGARCSSLFGLNLCLADCASDSDCRDGYACFLSTCRPPCNSDRDCGTAGGTCESGRCVGPECGVDADCGGGMRCSAGMCLPPLPDGGGMTPEGAPCTRSPECATGICLPPELGGVCTRACANRMSCLEFNDVCTPVAWDPDGDGTADSVVAACAAGDETARFLAGLCSSNTDCESHACLNGECTEACTSDGDCLPGQACTTLTYPGPRDPSFRGCGYAARAGAIQVVDLDVGTATVSTGSMTPRMHLAAAPDAASVTLIAEQPTGELLPLVFVDVYDADGLHVFSFEDLSMWIDPPVRWFPIDTEEEIAMLVPNSTPDRIAFQHGRYSFNVAALPRRMGDVATADIRLRARVKRGDVDAGLRTLDLNVFLVGVGLTAAAAASDSRLQPALREMSRILTAVGVQLGTIEYIQITGSDATTYSVIDSSDGADSEMSRLLRLSASRTNDAVNLFIVRAISAGAGEGGIALGIAGGIPGPPGIHGTMHSGVLVSFDRMVVGDDPNVVAQIAAHEVSHYLGLYHNHENGAPCPAGTGPTMADPCAPFGGNDVLADTARSDGTNLMWFALGGSDGRTYNVALSDGQGFVLRRNPLTH